jgi:dipeptidase E
MAKRLLLISNSTQHGGGYLEHCAAEIQDFLGSAVRRVAFVPYALADHDGYAGRVRERFAAMGYEVEPVHAATAPAGVVERADAVFIGGGNTFRLLARMYEHGLIAPIRARVAEGMPYIGSSAGSNVACVTIKTTNDMPIVEPPSFEALALVPFNINPHYLDSDPSSTHQGETRDKRILQFHEENAPLVLGLREGSWLNIEGPQVTLKGSADAKLFRRGEKPQEFKPGSSLSFLLDSLN